MLIGDTPMAIFFADDDARTTRQGSFTSADAMPHIRQRFINLAYLHAIIATRR